ncbi:hypothetical protein K491DRAFT_253347 [Lophiostoma macrostomum CBS 122681]|uniref:Uncharacterized protein n=1 Tax=Lophiostoma macrostomum CBS 122681 TaxID=1314788 RepID=A0A6A6TG13_9PLEO|nr:hypothetical protein K491DRAFT_253347 [Lophiostoma macrostomum CBS 122681]
MILRLEMGRNERTWLSPPSIRGSGNTRLRRLRCMYRRRGRGVPPTRTSRRRMGRDKRPEHRPVPERRCGALESRFCLSGVSAWSSLICF